MRVEGKSIIVTGGASGLGAATVRRLSSLEAQILIADLDSKGASVLKHDLEGKVSFAHTDVTDAQSMERAINKGIEHGGGLDVLVNCAGICPPKKVLGKDKPHGIDSFSHVLNINLVGTFNAISLAASVMRENQPNEEGERGVIVNTASVAAFDGQIGQAAYSASKGGVVSMTLPIARELASYGIRVISIAPGVFDTPILDNLPKSSRLSLEKTLPFPPRLGKPEEYAALVQHIIENVMLNGTTIRLDGALRMGSK